MPNTPPEFKYKFDIAAAYTLEEKSQKVVAENLEKFSKQPVLLDSGIIYYNRKLTRVEIAYVKGLACGLLVANYDLV